MGDGSGSVDGEFGKQRIATHDSRFAAKERFAASEASKQRFDSYRDLRVWAEGMDLAEACYTLTKGFPREEIFGITSQVRRAAVSIPANIAEGHGRETPGDFVRFLRIAQGSLKEVETHLILAARVGLATGEEISSALERCETVGKMLRALIRSRQKKAANR